MLKGRIFDIKEFSINDGPGIRTTVFMKGCPLRCAWCHNPEGISPLPQKNLQTGQFVGRDWDVDELVEYLYKYTDFFSQCGGGITFSGGEPTAQTYFLIECIKKLKPIHIVLDTSGYCDSYLFQNLSQYIDLFYFDLKLGERENHKKYTGVTNDLIIQNLRYLINNDKNIIIRIPLIPHITDTEENLSSLATILLENSAGKPLSIHLLPYNTVAGGKYPIYGMKYELKDNYNINNKIAISNFSEYMKNNNFEIINYLN